LEHDEQCDAARQALRGFLQSIIIPPGDGLLQVTGNLGAMLEAAADQKMPGRQAVGYVGCGGVQPAVLAAVVVGCVVSDLAGVRPNRLIVLTTNTRAGLSTFRPPS
jgi:hypothetical protein